MSINELGQELSKYLLRKDDEIDFKIKHGTEMYRKGFGHFLTIKDVQGNVVEKAEIRLKQKTHEYLFGCNAFMLNQFPNDEQNRQYEATFAKLFNEAVIPFYWSDLEPEDGKPRFKSGSNPIYRRPPPDEVLDFCIRNNITPKGHPLCWSLYIPDWAPRNEEEMLRRLNRRLREIAERYSDKIFIWDCVNEAQAGFPTGQIVPLSKVPAYPSDHAEKVFKLADRYFSDAHLIYNDDRRWWHYNGDYTEVYLLVKALQEHGCRVGGLGLQYHMFEDLFPQAKLFMDPHLIYKCLDLYAKLNVPVNFSEVSIVSRRDLGDGDHFQELVTERLYRLWFSHPATNAIVWWNMVDGTGASAPMGSEDGENSMRAGLVNYDFSGKPAYHVLDHLINHEWRSEAICHYEAGGVNTFHGFYGKYDAEIRTDAGTFKQSVSLRKDGNNYYDIVLK